MYGLLQIDFLCEILQKCKEQGLHTAVDTAGNVPWEFFEKIMEYTDLFLYDIKIFDTIKHKMYTGVGNERILENLQRLLARKANVFIRIPVIGGVNDTEEEMLRIQKFLEPYHVLKIELLPYHKMGNHKCEALGRTAAVFETPDKDTMERLNGIMYRN